MSLHYPRMAFGPVRSSPSFLRSDFAPLFNLFDDTLKELQQSGAGQGQGQNQHFFAPKFDVKEDKDAYTLDGELPGIEQKDVSIEFTDEHTLTIKGRTERQYEEGTRPGDVIDVTHEKSSKESNGEKAHQPTVEDEGEASNKESQLTTTAPDSSKQAAKSEPKHKYWISERSIGEFTRSFSFPARVNQEGVKASLKNGILTIVVPKAAAPTSRRIQIE